MGHSVTQTKNVSEMTAQKIDSEIRLIVDGCYDQAQEILKTNLDKLHVLAGALLEYETLSGEEIGALLRGESIVRTSDAEAKRAERPSTVPTTGKKTAPLTTVTCTRVIGYPI